MWSAFVISLLLGLLAGYWLGKKVSDQANPDALNLERQLQALQQQLEKIQHENTQLLQKNADLTYQLGEEQKARAYAEQRSRP